MDLDLKSVSAFIAIASAVVGLAFKLMPRSSDRLKRDLKLLKLTREAEANYLPLQRRVDAQIHEEYVKEEIGINRRADIYFGNIFFVVLIVTPILSAAGLAIAFCAKLIFAISDDTTIYILGGFAALGLMGGISTGITLANEEFDKIREEIGMREQITVRKDEETLRSVRAEEAETSPDLPRLCRWWAKRD